MGINAAWLTAALFAGCDSPSFASADNAAQQEERLKNPSEGIDALLSRWENIEWKEGANAKGPTVLLIPEVHFDPGDSGKENGATGALHRQLFEVERALIEGGATHLRHEASLIQALATYLRPAEMTASEYGRALKTTPALQAQFHERTGSPYAPAYGEILEVAFDENLTIAQRYDALAKYVGKAPAHELITAMYGIDQRLDLSELETIDVARVLQFQVLHNAVVKGERSIKMASSGEILSAQELRRRAAPQEGKSDAASVLGFCRLRASYQAMALQAQKNQEEREIAWANGLATGVPQGTLVVMTLGASHASGVQEKLIPGVERVGIFTANELGEALRTNGIDPREASTGQDQAMRVQRVLDEQLADLALTNTRTRVKEGCAALLRNIAH